MYPALRALGLAAGMAASALNLSGLRVMNRSVSVFLPFWGCGSEAARLVFIIHYRTNKGNKMLPLVLFGFFV